MTTSESQPLIGKTGTVSVPMGKGMFKIAVRIVNARSSFGRDDVKVEPVHGSFSGECWIALTSVNLEK